MSLAEKLEYLRQTKALIKQAIRNKGQTVTDDDSFRSYVPKIEKIKSYQEENDIQFYDYDGTLLYSYSIAEFANKTELPPLPSREGLTCQGWNWSLADIKAQNKPCDIGAMYVTDDGKTRLYISITCKESLTKLITLYQEESESITIDWGDNTTSTLTGANTEVEYSHTYSTIGDYVITISVTEGNHIGIVGDTGSYHSKLLGVANQSSINSNLRGELNSLKKIELGSNVKIYSQAFNSLGNVKSINIPQGTLFDTPTYVFSGLGAKCVIIPSMQDTTTLNGLQSWFTGSRALMVISIPNNITLLNNVFQFNGGLKRVTIPNSVISTNNLFINECSALEEIILPSTMTYITNTLCYNGYSLKKVVFPTEITSTTTGGKTLTDTLRSCEVLTGSITVPEGVETLTGRAFQTSALEEIIFPSTLIKIEGTSTTACPFVGNYSMKLYDFRKATVVPSLKYANSFTNGIHADCKIVVPDSLYNTWITTTNWSNTNIVNHIIKASVYEAS